MSKGNKVKNIVITVLILIAFVVILFNSVKKFFDGVSKVEVKNLETSVEVNTETNTEEHISKTIKYDELDLEEGYDIDAAVVVNFDENKLPDGTENLIQDDGENVVIKSGGIYVLKGTLNNKRVKIENGVGPRTQLVLDGTKINTDKETAILTDKNCITQIHLAEGSVNEINSHVETAGDKTAKLDGVIHSKEALSFTGLGKLIINNDYECSIESDDKLTFISGDFELNSKGDGIKAKNEIAFKEATVSINSGDDAIRATSNKNGNVYVENATITIHSNDKGINSDSGVIMLGGNMNFDTKGESISGKTVDISGGKINIKSGDDGINSSDANQNKKANQVGVYVRVAGGEINIDSVMDGIDSNGDLYLEGGKLYINGSENETERIIDYNGVVTCGKGFEMVGVGPGAKMQDLGVAPSQNYIIIYYNDVMKAGNKIEIRDEKNSVMLSYTPHKTYKAAILTSANLEVGKEYKIISGEVERNITLAAGKNEITE